jgi:hypothetical protein
MVAVLQKEEGFNYPVVFAPDILSQDVCCFRGTASDRKTK